MIGKKFISTVSCFILFFSPSVFGAGGMVVTDTIAYTYLAKTATDVTKQLAEMKKMAGDIKEAKDSAMNTVKSVKGLYFQALGTVNWMKDALKELEENPLSTVERLTGIDVEGEMKSMVNVIEEEYSDVAYNNIDWFLELGKMDMLSKSKAEQDAIVNGFLQSFLKKGIEDAEKHQSKAKEKLKKVIELTEKINQAESLKEATDLSSTIQVEILSTLNEILDVIVNFAKIQFHTKYKGFNEEQFKKLVASQKSLNLMMKKGIEPYQSNGFEIFYKYGVKPPGVKQKNIKDMGL